MNRILVPIDFDAYSANALKYALTLSKAKGMSLSLLHCYPKEDYKREFEIEGDYDKGVRRILKEFYQKHIGEDVGKTRFVARMGGLVEKVVNISSDYQFIVLSSHPYTSTFQRWVSSRASVISSNAKCPVFIIPPRATYLDWSNIWHFKRNENETEALAKKWKGELDIVQIKTLQQSTFSSLLWQYFVEYVEEPKDELLEAIKAENPKDKIDLIILVSQSGSAFEKFIDDESIQVIFQFGIPVVVIQAGI